MKLLKLKDLTEDEKKIITEEHNSILAKLKQDYAKLFSEKTEVDKLFKDQNLKIQQDSDKLESDKIAKADTIDDLKKLLNVSNANHKALEQRIINDEKARVEAGNLNTIGSFVDGFINQNVVEDSLVRGAIKTSISKSLVVRDGNILEVNSSNELTGRTGNQVLSDAKSNNTFSKHLIATRANGGGADGGSGEIIAAKTMTRDEYETAPLENSAQFLRDGGSVI